MPKRKADTTIDQLINIISDSEDNPLKLEKFIDALLKTIPVRKGKNMPKVDPYLNKRFKLRRINYTVIGSVESKQNNLYTVAIKSIEYDENIEKKFMKVGDTLTVSKRELEIGGKPA